MNGKIDTTPTAQSSGAHPDAGPGQPGPAQPGPSADA
jgi:hypothetical protein